MFKKSNSKYGSLTKKFAGKNKYGETPCICTVGQPPQVSPLRSEREWEEREDRKVNKTEIVISDKYRNREVEPGKTVRSSIKNIFQLSE